MDTHRNPPVLSSPAGRAPLVAVLVLAALAMAARAHAGDPFESEDFPLERPDDPPTSSAQPGNGTSPPAIVTFGRFTSVQVNLDAAGFNVTQDAANEPSIAVDPNDPDRIAIGWRQFDSIRSNFRQAGFGFSADGGLTWTAGVIDPGVFRSDPVLGFDAEGKFFYNSLTGDLQCWVLPSIDGGATWAPIVSAYGGDKQWMTIDRTSGPGRHQVYETWSASGSPFTPNSFSRSIDAGQSFQAPIAVPSSPYWGTLDVGPDGTLYLVGTDSPGTIHVVRSTDAQDPAAVPTFTTVPVNLGGTIQTGGPNPVGLLGQLWIAVDRSTGPRSGWVYVLASVRTATDPLDVMFIRSTDGGQTWSTPRRVNDDAPGNRAFQWFGTLSVSPEGRLDAVWNDTRGSADSTQSALYYSCSYDGGATWSPNEQASPAWDSTVGWPKQDKIGDYYHMISRSDGADLAWAATFNGEQDVYFLRIPAGVTAVAGRQPGRLRLSGGRPNPFSSATTMRFEVPAGGARVKLEVFDATGRRVVTLMDGFAAGGTRSVRWSGGDDAGRAVKPGLYLCRLEAPGVVETAKVMRLR